MALLHLINVPVFGSSFALLRLWTMSRMDLMVPFILKLPIWIILAFGSRGRPGIECN
jgi:hypothetical protein